MEHRHSANVAVVTLAEEQEVTGGSAEPIELSPLPSPPQSLLSLSSTAVAPTEDLNQRSAHPIPPSRHGRSGQSQPRVTTGLSLLSSYSRLFAQVKAVSGNGWSNSWLGVSFDRKETTEGNSWVITINKVGRWFVYFHGILALVSIFDLSTTIYSWKSNADSDAMLQKILTAVSESGSHLKGIDSEIMKWINATKLHNAEEENRLAIEQSRWNALLEVFEDCGASQSRPNGTNTCDNLRRFFETNPLPHPDKSPIAKRNIAELDRIIRRVHLGQNSQPSPSSGIGFGPNSTKTAGTLLIVLVSIFSFSLLGYLFSRRLGTWNILKRYRKKVKHDADIFDEKQEEDAVDDDSVPIIATGGDYMAGQNNVYHRNLRAFDPHAAAAKGAVRDLIDSQEILNVNEIDKNNEYGSLLTAAARSGNLETVQYILSRNPDVNVQGGRYHNALQAGAHSGNDLVVHHLLKAGARDTSTGGFYGTAANAAAEKGSATMLRSLLNHYPDKQKVINDPGGSHGHALVAAAVRGDESAVQTLLSEGALVNQCNTGGTTALHQAVRNGHMETINLLLAQGAEVNTLSSIHGTPLHAACRGLQANAAKRLLATDVDVAVRDHRQRLALHEAAQAKEGLNEIFQDIVGRRPDLVDEVDADGVTALHLASIAGNVNTVKVLLDASADCSIGDKFQAQPLFRAAGCGHPEVVELLLREGKADPNATDCFGRAALHGPAETDDVRVHDFLIQWNANVNVTGSDRKTPLHEACNMGKIRNVELLLAHPNIKVNELDTDQFPPLYKALCSSDRNKDYLNKCLNRDIVTQLLGRDDIDVDVSNGIAVQEASRKGYQTEVETMLSKSKASIQMRGGKYGGVLQAASISGNLQLVNLLLKPEYHADVNLQGGEFGCPLAAAAAFGHVTIIRRLLEAGANPSVSGIGRYHSPLQSTCRKVDDSLKAKQGRKWASVEDEIRGLLREYGSSDDSSHAEEKYKDWRWQLTLTGWGWRSPGDM